MAASENKKKKCETIIPSDWPKFETPAMTTHMTPAQARSAWFGYLRSNGFARAKVGDWQTPRVYRHQA